MKRFIYCLLGLIFIISFTQCEQQPSNISKDSFGTLSTGESVDIYTMKSSTGIEVQIMTYGGAIVSIKTPDKNGILGEVTLGFDNLPDYENNRVFFGASIGRFGNRIAKGKFSIDDVEYKLETNDGENHLHGGVLGFDRVIWDAEAIDCENPAIKLSYLSKDGEEGYPGNLEVAITYSLKGDSLEIDYEAKTDKSTPVNLTNHTFYNLAGDGKILNHILTINSKSYTPIGKTLIPTGEIASIKNTPFDFTEPISIGERIAETGYGYDHNYVLTDSDKKLKYASKLYEPNSGKYMEILTTEPGLQFYSGNFLNGSLSNGDRIFERYSGLCLETQHFPDSPNQPNFPSTILKPDDVYKSQTIMVFGIE